MNIGVILTRGQPIHKGHILTIKKALSENDKVLIVLGSANKKLTKRNPFSINYRLKMLENELNNAGINKDYYSILRLDDWSKEDAYEYAKEWGKFFYYNIVNNIHQKEFTFYYNDNTEIVYNWFDDTIKPRITIKNSKRIDDISSTKVREAILNDNYEYLENVLCQKNINLCKSKLKDILLSCNNEDFIME